MKQHANLSVFVPHSGCPQRCLFCNQNRISGEDRTPSPAEVRALCEKFLPARDESGHTEIAFFGGSFTAIDRGIQRGLLAEAYPFVQSGRASGIRLSTRPDAIDAETLDFLAQYGVTAVELGAQSMDDAVLAANRRGHTAADVRRASALIRAHGGFSLGLQMMLGMYGVRDARADALQTAQQFIGLGADTVRIYPTVVVADTPLCALYRAGQYTPLTVAQAADIAGALLRLFEDAGVRVIRVGLHSDESLRASAVAGPFHPAFGEMCYSRVFRAKIAEQLPAGTGPFTVYVHPGCVSRALGYRRENADWFAAQGRPMTVHSDPALDRQTVRAEAGIRPTITQRRTDFASQIHRDPGLQVLPGQDADRL